MTEHPFSSHQTKYRSAISAARHTALTYNFFVEMAPLTPLAPLLPLLPLVLPPVFSVPPSFKLRNWVDRRQQS